LVVLEGLAVEPVASHHFANSTPTTTVGAVEVWAQGGAVLAAVARVAVEWGAGVAEAVVAKGVAVLAAVARVAVEWGAGVRAVAVRAARVVQAAAMAARDSQARAEEGAVVEATGAAARVGVMEWVRVVAMWVEVAMVVVARVAVALEVVA